MPDTTTQQKAYKVLKIDQLTKMGDIGIEKYYRVTYKTKGGIRDDEDFSEKEYTEKNVDEVLTKQALKHDKIKAL